MIVWPFFPNWKSRYTETYEYLTEIITSDSGKEQRRAWRQTARRSASYRALVQRDRLRALRRLLLTRGGQLVFPDEVRRAQTLMPSTGATVQFALPLPPWLAAGRQVIFEDRRTRQRELRSVDLVVGGVVTFAAPSDSEWASGTRVMPALVGTLSTSVRSSAVTNEATETPVDLNVEPGTEIEEPGLAADTFGGLEVFTHRPDWSERIEFETIDPTTWTDFGIGVRAAYRAVDFVSEVIRHSHLIRTSDHLDQVLGLFQRSRGRQGEFYAPSWLNDITLAAPTAAGSKVFTVEGHEFHDAYADDTVRRCFMVRMSDGTRQYFRIESMAKSVAGPPLTLITTTAPAATDINAATASAISWMPVCRFASDSMTVSWITNTVAEITVNLQTLEDLP